MSMFTRALGVLVVVAIALMGCGGEEAPPAAPCPHRLDGECVGVPVEELCASDPCTSGVSCATVHSVANDSELQQASAVASAGDCIALAAGSYGAVALGGGVSLLGRSADRVHVASVALGAGAGSWLRGFEVSDGIDVDVATEVRIEAVRVTGGMNGIRAGTGASVTISQVEISGSAAYGVAGASPASVTLERSYVHHLPNAVVIQCSQDGCDCPVLAAGALDRVLIEDAEQIGVSLIGVAATLSKTEIHGPAGALTGSRGMAIAGCSQVTATGVRVDHTTRYGILVQNSGASLGGGLGEKGIIIVDSKPGIWLQGSLPMVLDGVELRDCGGAGIGLDTDAFGIIIVDSLVGNTGEAPMPTELNPNKPGLTAEEMAYGLVWKMGAAADVQGLEISSTAQQAVLIDGPVGGGSLVGLTLSGGDEETGIVQQQVAANDASPMLGTNEAELTKLAEKVYEVPTVEQ